MIFASDYPVSICKGSDNGPDQVLPSYLQMEIIPVFEVFAYIHSSDESDFAVYDQYFAVDACQPLVEEYEFRSGCSKNFDGCIFYFRTSKKIGDNDDLDALLRFFPYLSDKVMRGVVIKKSIHLDVDGFLGTIDTFNHGVPSLG